MVSQTMLVERDYSNRYPQEINNINMSNISVKGSFQAFFKEHYNTVIRFAMSFLEDEYDSKDIAQDTFIKLYQSWNSIGTLEQARSYMYTTAHNLCISHLRHRSIEEQYVQNSLENAEPEHEEFFSEVTYQETLRLLRKAIEELPSQSRQIILLGLEGKNNAEIAEQLGISVNTVKKLKKGAYKSLRQSLGGLSEELFIMLLVMLA